MHRSRKKHLILGILAAAALAAVPGCTPPEGSGDVESKESSSMTDSLKSALTFHTSFEDGPDAAFALGDRRIYTAPSYEKQDQALPGIGNPAVEIVADAGRFGHALRFNKKNVHAIFYRGEKNAAFTDNDWSGSVSFWLNLNPDGRPRAGLLRSDPGHRLGLQRLCRLDRLHQGRPPAPLSARRLRRSQSVEPRGQAAHREPRFSQPSGGRLRGAV